MAPAPSRTSKATRGACALLLCGSASAQSWKYLKAGGSNTCGISTLGDLFCWGRDGVGQLGVSGTTNTVQVPVLVQGVRAEQVAIGEAHICGLNTTGAVMCWGSPFLGALGVNESVFDSCFAGQSCRRTPKQVPGIVATQIAGGGFSTCALNSTGNVYCWGLPYRISSTDSVAGFEVPRLVANFTAARVARANLHGCLIDATSNLFCWGYNSNGQVGDGTTTERRQPVLVQGLKVTDAAVGTMHTCAVAVNGTLFCWGANEYGQLGDGSTTDRLVPTQVPGIVASRVALGRDHSCALDVSGRLYCWGANYIGQLGDGAFNQVKPMLVLDATFTQLAVGEAHTCVLTAQGVALCWGNGFYESLAGGFEMTVYKATSAIRIQVPGSASISGTTRAAAKAWVAYIAALVAPFVAVANLLAAQ